MEQKNQYTAAALRALELAAQKALAEGRTSVGTEYLLLGLAAEPDGTPEWSFGNMASMRKYSHSWCVN